MDAHQMSHKRKKTCLLTCSLHATATASQLLNYIFLHWLSLVFHDNSFICAYVDLQFNQQNIVQN
jgi:hypothetical protein